MTNNQKTHLPLRATVASLLVSALACTGAVDDIEGHDDGSRDDSSSEEPAPGGSGGLSFLPNPGGSDDGDSSSDSDSGDSGDGDGDGTVSGPVDCSGIESAGFELCDEDGSTCGAVFTDGSGCSALCAAAGLTCLSAYDNVEGSCGGDTAGAALACDSGHESDYCLCGGNQTPIGGDGDGDEGSGGTQGSGGSGSGGSGSGGAGTGGSSNDPDVGPRACGCATSSGNAPTVHKTIVVKSGQTYDGGCKVYRGDPDDMGDGNQDENQLPIFELEDGAKLKNVLIDHSGADGIHTLGDVELENIRWLDVGEDAMTVKESGTVRLTCGSAQDGSDKMFQVNAASKVYISHFTAKKAGKFMRQNGSTTFKMEVFIDHCDISDMAESIYRTDSKTSHVTLTNSRYKNIGQSLFIFQSQETDGGGSYNQATVSNNDEY